ncbi:zinc ribbon domain-containing protein [Streptomyces lutosisoli]|uniref:Zinc ribbon domain-containing protein n=1 Tax=Streptomyces lutosisoli TaxID=2665721 RepID=A0ABW2VXE4_9ACTN
MVSETDFVAVQHLHADRPTAPDRTYLLAGLLHCALCERRMDSHGAHRPAYRCRHGHTSATPSAVERLRTMALTLTFDATARTLTTDTPRRERITIG